MKSMPRVCLCSTRHVPAPRAIALGETDRARLAGITHPQRRRAFLAGRAMLERMLPGSLERIRIEEHGKPVFGDGKGPAFSIAHSGERVACVVAGDGAERVERIGIDIESRKPRPRLFENLEAFLHPEEAAWLGEFSGKALADAFYRTWTVKEAVVKAIGSGLGDFRRFSVLGGEAPASGGGAGTPWQFLHWSLPSGWDIAVAWPGEAVLSFEPVMISFRGKHGKLLKIKEGVLRRGSFFLP